jgi:TPP-dependent pyruvate/acetoin dehydrogenase alpha subunit
VASWIEKQRKDKLADMYEKMMVTRHFEETAARLFTQGKVHGTAHFCIGEEATGMFASLDDLKAQIARDIAEAMGRF